MKGSWATGSSRGGISVVSGVVIGIALRDLDRADPGRGGALGEVERQLLERLLFASRFHDPPDRVPAVRAGGERLLTAQWALLALERGERDAALLRLVLVVKEVAEHE